MMRVFLFFCFLIPFAAYSDTIDFQARAAYFYPQDEVMRRVYGNGWDEYELEASLIGNHCFFPWINISYFEEEGHSTCFKESTFMRSWSFGIGIKRIFCPCRSWSPYLGLGAGADYVRFHDKSPYEHHHIDKWGPTLIFKSGMLHDLRCNFFVDLFVDYTYNWLNRKKCNDGIKERKVNTGGAKVGIGIGYHFGPGKYCKD